jgi:hypothetical protein
MFGHFLNVKDFVKKLNLCNFAIDPHHDINLDVVSIEQVTEVFGSRNANGFKVKVNDHSTKKDCGSLNHLNQIFYVHPLTYGNHPSIFIWGFLVNCHGMKMNWAKYIHSCTQRVNAWYDVNNFREN